MCVCVHVCVYVCFRCGVHGILHQIIEMKVSYRAYGAPKCPSIPRRKVHAKHRNVRSSIEDERVTR